MEKASPKQQRVIVALDFPTIQTAESFLSLWDIEEKLFVKVGMQLFYTAGPTWVAKLVEQGYAVFLDLKLHDIPNTVAGAIRSLAHLGVKMITLHAAGGRAMMEAAKEAASQSAGLRLLAVTQLTSTDKYILNEEIGIPGTVEESVGHYVKLAHTAGMDGVICSGWEAPIVKTKAGKDFLVVTPGIRLPQSAIQDQKRVMTPDMAIQMGADYIVVGRSITQAADPLEAYQKIQEMVRCAI